MENEMDVTIANDELYKLIKKAVREVFYEEKMELFLKEVSLVSDEEMDDIEKLYGKAPAKKEVAFDETIEI